MGEDNAKKRIGLFGGTFDPVHNGHLAIARQAAVEAELDEVLFIPAADPPHKAALGASFWHRVAMLETVLGRSVLADDRFAISLIEAELPFPSYTVDTLVEIKKRFFYPKCYFIIGADSLLDLHRWYRYQKLLSLTHLIVVSRPGISLTTMQSAIKRLPGSFQPAESDQRWLRPDGAEILLLMNQLTKDISSTMIRSELRQGRAPEEVDLQVREYIARQGLYRNI
ncbi:nicotinate (nicotinamide) nucleotide adenylyltransferase [Candidatus Electrothrix sp.]|uniref:nicotinate (nicotinamide) nucleotide adenylyltransferase n=1 Tax=Candidatus Electrothrix sp. TaxID=2170559 RepID=UPI004055F409